MAANNEKKQRKKTAVIPHLILDASLPRRRTRSTEAAEGGEGGEDGDDCSSSPAVVPSMVASTHGTRASFRSHNALVLDPVEEEVKRHYLNVWSEEEKLVFVEKLVDFSLLPESKGMRKNFHRISEHLPNKTTRDCVQFYYLNKKTKLFKVLNPKPH
jgi:nuclear receptor co-repressor 1